MTYAPHTVCRACRYPALVSVLDLGSQPLANGFRNPALPDSPEAQYPLHLLRCPECELLQLSVVVEPSVLYGQHYPYRSAGSPDWALHCHGLAKTIGRGKRVLEIGCLDGVLLGHCAANGCEVQGIDPSAPPLEYPVRRELFGRETRLDEFFDVIVAQNVFGHVNDAEGFLLAARRALSVTGSLILECPWMVDLVDGVRWDTIYHEHLSYWSLRPLMRLARATGLTVNQVKAFPTIHGGTMRYYLSHRPEVAPDVYAIWKDEEMSDADWRRFRSQAERQIENWDVFFRFADERIGAYGASAKLNTVLNALPTRPDLIAVYDDSPAKIGLFTPGWGFPVKAPSREEFESLDILLCGSPNWLPTLERQARAFGFVGEVKSLWR